jgi:hypothetical protein
MAAARKVLDESGHADHAAVRVLNCCRVCAGPFLDRKKRDNQKNHLRTTGLFLSRPREVTYTRSSSSLSGSPLAK